MNITFFGTYNVKTTPRVQTLIDGLGGHSFTINQCNIPLMVGTAERIAIARQPWRLPLFGLKILWCWLRLIFKRIVTPRAKYVIVGYMGQFDVMLARLLYPTRHIMLDYMVSGAATVRDRKASGGFKDKLLVWLDNTALRCSTTVIVDTEEHLQDIPLKYRHKGLVVLVGAPTPWFETHKSTPQKTSKTLKVIFFGLYTPLQGAVTIGKALAKLKQPIEVTMAGTGQDYEEARAAAQSSKDSTTINWVEWADSGVIAQHDICLGIFGSESKALKVVPNKVYQGAAVGCGLITSDTPPQRRVLKDIAVLVPPNDETSLAAALDDLAAHPKKVTELRQKAHTYAVEHFTPEKVVEPLITIIK